MLAKLKLMMHTMTMLLITVTNRVIYANKFAG